jgi:endosialidase-like protein
MKNNLIITIIIITTFSGINSFAQPWHQGGDAITAVKKFGSTTNFPVNFITNNATRMTLSKTGYLGIGTVSPNVPLQVAVGSDVTLSSGGYFQIGTSTGFNLDMDENEIQSRNNGVANNLYLNNGGGDVHIGSSGLVFDGTGSGITFNGGQTLTPAIGGPSGLLIKCHSDYVPDADDFHALGTSSLKWTAVWAVDGTINTSDATLKNNIQNLTYGLNEVMKLRPVSFRWKQNDDGHTRLGLIAQEVKTVVPEAVRDWQSTADEKTGKVTVTKTDKLGIQYDAIIPVLVKAIQDQQQELNDYKDRLAKLENVMSNDDSKSTALSSISLWQNAPNPSNTNTNISYNIPVKFNTAKIVITDYSGKSLKEINITSSGKGNLQVNTATLIAGTYTYSLIVDGKLIDSKKMSVSK